MDAPYHQRLLRWGAFLLAGFISLGALLDAISNAVILVPPRLTYVASAVLVVSWLLTEITARLFGIDWLSRGDMARVKSLGPQLRFGLFGVLILLWIPRLGDLPVREAPMPYVQVNLVNSGSADVSVARRGEFVLWLPTAMYDGAPRVGGRFAFVTGNPGTYEDAPIVLKKGTAKSVAVKLLGAERFLGYLEREDTDLTLMVGTDKGISISDEITFSRGALESRYLEWELSKEPRLVREEQIPAAEQSASTGRPASPSAR